MRVSELFSVVSVGKKESCRMGICSVFEFKKRGGDRIWRSLCVCKTDLQHSLNQWGLAPRLFPHLQGCAMLTLLGLEREARQGQHKGEQSQGCGLPFLPYQTSKPCSYAKKLVCVSCGQAQAAATQCQVLLGNCLWGKNVYSPQLPNYAARLSWACWMVHKPVVFISKLAGAVISLVHYSNVCIGLLLPFLFSH